MNEKSVFHEKNNFETRIWNILIFKVTSMKVRAHKNKLQSVKRKKCKNHNRLSLGGALFKTF